MSILKLSAINDGNSEPVDWWFIYKLPHHAAPPGSSSNKGPKSTGYEYLYFDSETDGLLRLSQNRINTKNGALYNTLNQIYQTDKKGGTGRILYNDEIPETEHNDGRMGHTKGVLAFDTDSDSAFWLLHSTPRFPLKATPDFPENEKIYGQTFLCITLKDVETADLIAEQMCREQEPQVYDSIMPSTIPEQNYSYQLTQAVAVNESDPPADVTFYSAAGAQFRLLAKNRHWDKDFWVDLIGPKLGVDFNIETWRRGTLPGTLDSDGKNDVKDVLYVNLKPLGIDCEWHYTKDHAKWATSRESCWICVADINRQVSQEKRGGGAICFQNEKLWQCLSQIEQFQSISLTSK